LRTRDRKATLLGEFTPGHTIEVMVQAVDAQGRLQGDEASPKAVITIAGKQDAPVAPTGVTATGYLLSILLAWTRPASYDYDVVEVWGGVQSEQDLATKLGETRGESWLDEVGSAPATRYYWLRTRATSGQLSGWTDPVNATTTAVVATQIDDFAVGATKVFLNTIVLSGDSWSNNSPGAGSIAWSAHYLTYQGHYYLVAAGSTALRYTYWNAGQTGGSGTVASPYLTTYAATNTYAQTANRFCIAVNIAGAHQLVWNSSANIVIGTAFILDAAITNAKIGLLAVDTANIALLAVTDACINTLSANKLTAGTIDASVITVTNLNADNITAGTLVVGRTEAKCTNALADQTSVNTAADTAKVQGSTIIVGGYIASDFLTATNIRAGTLTGRTVQTDTGAVGHIKRFVASAVNNDAALYTDIDGVETRVWRVDDDTPGFPGKALCELTSPSGNVMLIAKGADDYTTLTDCQIAQHATNPAAAPMLYQSIKTGGAGTFAYGIVGAVPKYYINSDGDIGLAGDIDVVANINAVGNIVTSAGNITSTLGSVTAALSVTGNSIFATTSYFHGITQIVNAARAIVGITGLTLASGNIVLTGAGALVDGVDVDAHHARHENGGADELSVAGLSGVLADAQTPVAHNQSATTITTGTLALDRGGLANATFTNEQLLMKSPDTATIVSSGYTAASFEAAGAIATHAALQSVHGLAITAAKTLTVQDNVTITGALGTAAYTATGAYAAAAHVGATGAAHGDATAEVAGFLTAAGFSAIIANTAKTTNATHSGDVTGSGALTIVNKVTMTGTSPVSVSGSPKVIAAGAVAISMPAASSEAPGHASAAHITALIANTSKLADIEAGADVTDATNVAAAGALMDGDFGSNGFMRRTAAGAYAISTVGVSTGLTVTTPTGNYIISFANGLCTGWAEA